MAPTNRLNPERLAAATIDVVPAGPLVVALGGGADSAVAAWAVAGHESVRGIFVRHGLAGSPTLERAARDLAAAVEIDIEITEAPVSSGPSLEDRARRARWKALERAVADAETIVTGHTGDDQAETVLMNLLRGAGNAGIAGMARSRPGVVRPLMTFTRAEVRALAEDLGLPFADDPANEDQSHLRNRIRADLLPMLDRDYRRGVCRVIARTGSLAADDDRVIEELAANTPVLEEGGAVLIPRAALDTAPAAVAARVVRRGLRLLLNPYAGATTDVDAVLSVSSGRADAVTISGALEVTAEGPFVVIATRSRDLPATVPIAIPSIVEFGAATIRFEIDRGRPVRRRSTLLVDRIVFDDGARLRCPVDGDRIDIEGGSKSVATVLSEHGIPRRRRPGWPVLASGGRIAAIVGIRVAPWARSAPDRVVAIIYERGPL